MAQTIAFHFRAGTGFLHRMDPRCKIICLALISLSTLKALTPGLLLLTLLFGILVLDVHLPGRTIFFELRYFGLFLLVVFVSKCLTQPGTSIFSLKGVSITHEGVIEGLLASWRLALVILMGLLFSVSTRPKDIRTAVEHLLAPVPFVPEKRIAVMMGLIVRFIPVILSTTREISDAQRARAIDQRKNPIARMSRLVLPVMRRTIDRSQRLATAMESRCFDEDRPSPPLNMVKADWQAIMIVIIFCIVSLFI